MELAEGDHVAARLLDPVATGDPDVEQAIGHVEGDLLGPEDPDVVDARVVDGRPVVDRRATAHRQVGALEKLERRLLQRTLGQDQLQHGPNLPAGHPGPAVGFRPAGDRGPATGLRRREAGDRPRTSCRRGARSAVVEHQVQAEVVAKDLHGHEPSPSQVGHGRDARPG